MHASLSLLFLALGQTFPPSCPKEKEFTMTTQAVILAAVAFSASVSLSPARVSRLPSQFGQKGRPRKNGRIAVARGNLTPEQFSLHAMQAVVARVRGIADPKLLTHYARESYDDMITFVDQSGGVDSSTRVSYTATVEASPVEALVLSVLQASPLAPSDATLAEEAAALDIEAEA